MEQKIVATVTVCQQVGESTHRDRHHSRVFSASRSIKDILNWAGSITGTAVAITEIQLSEYDGESI